MDDNKIVTVQWQMLLSQSIDVITVFCSCHLMMIQNNKLLIIVALTRCRWDELHSLFYTLNSGMLTVKYWFVNQVCCVFMSAPHVGFVLWYCVSVCPSICMLKIRLRNPYKACNNIWNFVSKLYLIILSSQEQWSLINQHMSVSVQPADCSKQFVHLYIKKQNWTITTFWTCDV